MFGLVLNKYQLFSPTWHCRSQWRDTTSSGWKFRLYLLSTWRVKAAICDYQMRASHPEVTLINKHCHSLIDCFCLEKPTFAHRTTTTQHCFKVGLPLWPNLNPFPLIARLYYFHSFKAGIANAISSSKDEKNYIHEKWEFPTLNYSLTEHLPLIFLTTSDILSFF